MNIIVLGPQGSGKGTQAEILAKKYNLEHIEMGKFLREVAKLDTKLGHHIHETINLQGKLVDDITLKKVLHVKLADLPREQGIIFDGVPRRQDQLSYFEDAMREFGRKIGAVIDIKIPDEESVNRISKRRICRKSEHVLILGKDVKSEEEKCPICGSEIFQRIDDTPERIKTRLEIYHKDTKEVLDFYRDKGLLIEIDGVGSVEEVSDRIMKKISALVKKISLECHPGLRAGI
ncbi:MAG: nucleoside monophosphate kinase [Candidatus Moranbacteria bacterium]|nr:nucleoside monophosphate kinase [Candidatus Moranbacteria bacterium]